MIMVTVTILGEARAQFLELPSPIQKRVRDVFARLTEWPEVSGVKPLRRELKGCFRVRVGDWRVLFRPQGNTVTIFRIDNRRVVYE